MTYLVALHDLRRRVVRAGMALARSQPVMSCRWDVLVMGLIVFVPFVSRVHPIEVPRLPRPPLVFPIIACRMRDVLLDVEQLFFLVQISFGLSAEERFGGQVGVARCCFGSGLLLHGLCSAGDVARRRDATSLSDLFRSSTREQRLEAAKNGVGRTNVRKSSSSVTMSICRSSYGNLLMSSKGGLIERSYGSVSSTSLAAAASASVTAFGRSPRAADLATPANSSSCACKASSRWRFRSCSKRLRTTTSWRVFSFACRRERMLEPLSTRYCTCDYLRFPYEQLLKQVFPILDINGLSTG